MFLGKISVRHLVVSANPDDFGTEGLELLIRISKLAGFCCASLSEVFRIEVDDHVLLSTEVFEANILAGARLETKSGGGATQLDHWLDVLELGFSELSAESCFVGGGRMSPSRFYLFGVDLLGVRLLSRLFLPTMQR